MTAAAVGRGDPVGVAGLDGSGAALAAGEQTRSVSGQELARLETQSRPRWVWWRAATTAPLLDAMGVRPQTCWDLGAVGRLLSGGRRDDPAATWARLHDRPEPDPPGQQASLLDVPDDRPVGTDGRLSPDWAREKWRDVDSAARWAALALEVRNRQETALRALPDPRPTPVGPPLALLTAYAESAAALLAVELATDGLPLDRGEAERLLADRIGPRPDDPRRQQAERDAQVLAAFPRSAAGTDLRNPAQVRLLLQQAGIDVPDTRSWRLEPLRDLPGVAALLAWRKAERLVTTYGYGWLDRCVGADGRLRGTWAAADGAAGRMTASAGLHNLPAELRPAVAAEPGHLLVRADLGQVEPRVLAAVSGDVALAAAARADDMYAPVAAALGVDRRTAKVAVLAAMYGQTSGTAGVALRRMSRQYPQAIGYLDAAEQAGREGRDVRTYGGRRIRAGAAGSGRFARNAVVQGAAAELFKAWAATVRTGLVPLRGRIVLCLHDELLLHVPAGQAPRAVALLVDALTSTASWWAAGSGVRFVADVQVLSRWSDKA